MSARKQRSPEARAWQWMYSTPAWRARRAAQLKAKPLCERCEGQGRITSASVAHHVHAHKGDWQSFIEGPLASSCKRCHDSVEQSVERTGREPGSDATGAPNDPSHHWNK